MTRNTMVGIAVGALVMGATVALGTTPALACTTGGAIGSVVPGEGEVVAPSTFLSVAVTDAFTTANLKLVDADGFPVMLESVEKSPTQNFHEQLWRFRPTQPLEVGTYEVTASYRRGDVTQQFEVQEGVEPAGELASVEYLALLRPEQRDLSSTCKDSEMWRADVAVDVPADLKARVSFVALEFSASDRGDSIRRALMPYSDDTLDGPGAIEIDGEFDCVRASVATVDGYLSPGISDCLPDGWDEVDAGHNGPADVGVDAGDAADVGNNSPDGAMATGDRGGCSTSSAPAGAWPMLVFVLMVLTGRRRKLWC